MNLAIRLTGVGAAVLLPMIQPVMLGGAVHVLFSAVAQQPAAAQSAEAVAKVAQAITVRIEGATQGSGVLVKRDGYRYTVLTAWHVVSAQRPGEELSIYTPDGKEHHVKVEQSNRQRRTSGECLAFDPDKGTCSVDTGATLQDATVIHFYSSSNYSIAAATQYKNMKYCVTSDDRCEIYVAGFPASEGRTFTVTKGKLLANGVIKNNAGYSLVYSAPTRVGMSGGPVLDYNGYLLGIHARGDVKVSSPQNPHLRSNGEINQGVGLPCKIDFGSNAYAIPGTQYHGYKIESCD